MEKQTPPKLAFIHIPKTAGTFVRVFFDNLFLKEGWRNSLHDPFCEFSPYEENFKNLLKKGRDFDEDQLKKIIETEKSNELTPAFVHNHAANWSAESFWDFKNNKWITFSFARDFGDILCSYYFYLKKFINDDSIDEHLKPTPLTDHWNFNVIGVPRSVFEKLTLDEFVSIAARRKNIRVMPTFHKALDFIAPYSTENFAFFLKKYLDYDFDGKIPYVEGHEDSGKEKVLVSGNKGYEHYCKSGEISEATQKRIAQDWRQKGFKRIFEKSKHLFDQ